MDKTINWSSSDLSVASVSEEGVVTGIAVGSAVITALCGDVSAECKIEVLPEVHAESVTLDKSEVSLSIGESITLVAEILPEDTLDKTINWSSSALSVASVSEEGVVIGIAVGSAVITATCGEVSAECHVDVVDNSDVEEVSSDTPIQVYTLQGLLLYSDFDIRNLVKLEHGTYIVVGNNSSRKIRVK